MSSVLFIVLVHLVVINSLDVVLSVFIFYGYGDHRDLHVLTHSFPTRRSSDLYKLPPRFASRACRGGSRMIRFVIGVIRLYFGLGVIFGTIVFGSILYQYFAMERVKESLGTVRSEEHTSELQSLMRISYAVFCLKKKKTKTDIELCSRLKDRHKDKDNIIIQQHRI